MALVLAVMLSAVAPACASSGPAGGEIDVAEVYAAAIELVATRSGEPPTVVYVTTRPGSEPLPLEVQAGIVATLGDRLTVRFVDDEAEAVDGDEPLAPVPDGVLLRLSALVDPTSEMTFAVERYRQADDRQEVTVAVARTAAGWQARVVDAVPVTAP